MNDIGDFKSQLAKARVFYYHAPIYRLFVYISIPVKPDSIDIEYIHIFIY